MASEYFLQHPPIPLAQMVTAVNLDMIGSPRNDTVSVHGGLDSYLGSIVARVDSVHPELRLHILLEEGRSGGSDHINFVKRRIPMLFFHTAVSTYPHWHRATDSPDKLDADLETRLLRLVFRVIQEAANADQRPTPGP